MGLPHGPAAFFEVPFYFRRWGFAVRLTWVAFFIFFNRGKSTDYQPQFTDSGFAVDWPR